jgi:serine O-acetyltransferase
MNAYLRERARQHPRLREAIPADARTTLTYRSEMSDLKSRLDLALQVVRLLWVTDAFFALVCYRIKARLQGLGVPVLPRLFHRLAMVTAQVCIGDPVIMAPGVYIAHGQVVVDGLVTIGTGTVLLPWITVGLVAGQFQGPTIGSGVQIGTGAKVLGPITIGDGASIGANAVVLKDVAAGSTVVGVPARPTGG